MVGRGVVTNDYFGSHENFKRPFVTSKRRSAHIKAFLPVKSQHVSFASYRLKGPRLEDEVMFKELP